MKVQFTAISFALLISLSQSLQPIGGTCRNNRDCQDGTTTTRCCGGKCLLLPHQPCTSHAECCSTVSTIKNGCYNGQCDRSPGTEFSSCDNDSQCNQGLYCNKDFGLQGICYKNSNPPYLLNPHTCEGGGSQLGKFCDNGLFKCCKDYVCVRPLSEVGAGVCELK